MRASRPRPDKPFEDTDTAPLLYLDHLLNRHAEPEFDHVVVDEAQETSPLEIELLAMHSRNGWFTILGDLRQRTVPYKGISSWQDLRAVFGSAYAPPLISRVSYRSTAEITRFANRILRRIPGPTLPPQPHDRRGDRPKLQKSRSATEMYRMIGQRARSAQEHGVTVGVLTRTSVDAKVLAEHLVRGGLRDAQLLTPDAEIETGLTVSPILLTKGLEFDVVIVAGVDASSFTGSDMDNRLLYLACTRARHFLEIHWFGVASPIIVDVGPAGTDLAGQLEVPRSKRSILRRIFRR